MASELWHQNMDAAVRKARYIRDEADEMHYPPWVKALAESIIELAEAYPDGYEVSDPS